MLARNQNQPQLRKKDPFYIRLQDDLVNSVAKRRNFNEENSKTIFELQKDHEELQSKLASCISERDNAMSELKLLKRTQLTQLRSDDDDVLHSFSVVCEQLRFVNRNRNFSGLPLDHRRISACDIVDQFRNAKHDSVH